MCGVTMEPVGRTALEEAAGFYSDYHKDVYGFRPRLGRDWTLEDYEQAIKDLEPIAARTWAAEAAAEAEAINELEATILRLIGLGAADRAAAIRWLHESEKTGGDNSYLCFQLGVPYGYIK